MSHALTKEAHAFTDIRGRQIHRQSVIGLGELVQRMVEKHMLVGKKTTFVFIKIIVDN